MSADRSPEQIAQALEDLHRDISVLLSPAFALPWSQQALQMRLNALNEAAATLRRLASAPPSEPPLDASQLDPDPYRLFRGTAQPVVPPTCQTCRFWDRVVRPVPMGVGLCMNPEFPGHLRPQDLFTSDFGCTLHEAP